MDRLYLTDLMMFDQTTECETIFRVVLVMKVRCSIIV